MFITKAEASNLLQRALRANYEPAVKAAMPGARQHEFDAGIGFHWNLGAIGRASWVKAWRAKKPRAEIGLQTGDAAVHVDHLILQALLFRGHVDWRAVLIGQLRALLYQVQTIEGGDAGRLEPLQFAVLVEGHQSAAVTMISTR